MENKGKKIALITNEFFDAIYSRMPLASWIEQNSNHKMQIICLSKSSIVDPPVNRKVIAFKENKIKRILLTRSILNEFDIIIYRGLETIFTSIVFPSKENIFLVTGLGRIYNLNGLIGRILKLLSSGILKELQKMKNAKIIVQNDHDLKILKTKGSIIYGSGFYPVSSERNKKINKYRKVITATRLIKEKGLNEIFELCEIIKNDIRINYVILGDLSKLKKKHLELIKHYNSYPNISFKGFQETTEFIKNADFAYYPTKYMEGSPRFLIEALAYGLVIFTNNMPGCEKIVSNKNGYLNLTPKEITEKIRNMKNKDYLSMSKNSKDLFKKTYTAERIFNEYLKIINSI